MVARAGFGTRTPLEWSFLKSSNPPSPSRLKTSDRSLRRAPRLEVEIEATLVGRVSHPVRLVDLSATGCLVRCETHLEPGVILDLRLVLVAEPFQAKARVVESSLDGDAGPDGAAATLTGLQFLSLAARDETCLRRFLEGERRRRRSADAPAD